MSIHRGRYAEGFAPRDFAPRYPSLWSQCLGAWSPGLGPTGITLRDWSPKRRMFTLNGTAAAGAWAVNQGRYALKLDGTTNFCDLSNNATPLIPATDNWMLSVWVFVTSVSNEIGIFGQYIGTTGNGRLLLFKANTSGGKWTLFVGDKSPLSNASIPSVSAPAANTWTHIAAARNGNTFELHINGTLEASSTDGSRRSLLQCGNLIGAYSNNLTTYNGSSIISFLPGAMDDLFVVGGYQPALLKLLSSRRGIAYEYERTPRLMTYMKKSSGGLLLRRRKAVCGL